LEVEGGGTALFEFGDLLRGEDPLDLERGQLPRDVVAADHQVGDLAGIHELLELRVTDLPDLLLNQIAVQEEDQRHRCDEVPQ
jgi:hypothetical protein